MQPRMHESWLHPDWLAVYNNLRATTPEETPVSMIYFAIFELGRGFIAMLLYVLMRDRFSPGPKTAVLAGVITWVAFSLTGPAQFIPLGFFSNALWMKMGAASADCPLPGGRDVCPLLSTPWRPNCVVSVQTT